MKSIYISILLFLFSVNSVMAAPSRVRILDEPRVIQITPVPINTITPTPSSPASDSITPSLSPSPSESISPTPSSPPSESVTPRPSSSPSPTGNMISPSPTPTQSGPTASPAPTSVSMNIVATPTDKPTPIQSVSQVVQEAYQPPNPVISS